MNSIQKTIDEYVEIYDIVRTKTESDETAIAILQEIGKDKRTERISESKKNELASDKQKKFMSDLGIEFPKTVTKKEAIALISEEVNKE